jgi:hypothetical protein
MVPRSCDGPCMYVIIWLLLRIKKVDDVLCVGLTRRSQNKYCTWSCIATVQRIACRSIPRQEVHTNRAHSHEEGKFADDT